MRLGQLARKIAIKPSELIDFLTTKGIPTEAGINTRLEDTHIQLIVRSLAPDKIMEITQEAVVPEELEIIIEQANLIEPVTVAEVEQVIIAPEEISEAPAPTPSLKEKEYKEEQAEKEEATVIKAPKVELQGLKVLGKIELPELKKKEASTEVTNETEIAPAAENKPAPAVRKSQPVQRRERTEQRPAKNPIALKREQEALEAEQRRKERAEREKEKRTQNYLKRVKSAPTKAVKRMEEQVTEVIEEDEAVVPKTWLGKLFRWFKS